MMILASARLFYFYKNYVIFVCIDWGKMTTFLSFESPREKKLITVRCLSDHIKSSDDDDGNF